MDEHFYNFPEDFSCRFNNNREDRGGRKPSSKLPFLSFLTSFGDSRCLHSLVLPKPSGLNAQNFSPLAHLCLRHTELLGLLNPARSAGFCMHFPRGTSGGTTKLPEKTEAAYLNKEKLTDPG